MHEEEEEQGRSLFRIKHARGAIPNEMGPAGGGGGGGKEEWILSEFKNWPSGWTVALTTVALTCSPLFYRQIFCEHGHHGHRQTSTPSQFSTTQALPPLLLPFSNSRCRHVGTDLLPSSRPCFHQPRRCSLLAARASTTELRCCSSMLCARFDHARYRVFSFPSTLSTCSRERHARSQRGAATGVRAWVGRC